MHFDDVTCSNCEQRSIVPMGTDECPTCGMIGALAWSNPDAPEVARDA